MGGFHGEPSDIDPSKLPNWDIKITPSIELNRHNYKHKIVEKTIKCDKTVNSCYETIQQRLVSQGHSMVIGAIQHSHRNYKTNKTMEHKQFRLTQENPFPPLWTAMRNSN